MATENVIAKKVKSDERKEVWCKINKATQAVIGPGMTGIKLPINPSKISKIPMIISAKSIFKSEVLIHSVPKNKNV